VKGWQLCVRWKDGSTSWEKLADLKECYPVEVSEWAVASELDDEPAFNWWVHHTLKKRDRIISLVKQRQTRYLEKTHKFGVELPKSVRHAYELDKKNGNTFWADAISKEMKNVRVAFRIKDEDEIPKNVYQRIKCHMIFDVKMEDFRRKARMVAGGHMTETPKCMTYSSVVARDTVRIALTLAALNGLEVKAGDVMNAYITAPIEEKVWTVLGPEFGDDAGKAAIIVRALYGLKSAGACFRKHLASCMRHLGYEQCKADLDLWMKPEIDPADGYKYWSYVLIYVDDILVIHHDAMVPLKRIGKYFLLKPDSVGDPDMYLGAKLRSVVTANGVECWSLSPSKYVQEACKNCRQHLTENFDGKFALPKDAANPFPVNFEPQIDTSAELGPDEASYFQSLVGIMRWMVEIGRVDIAVECSLLSSHLALPRENHLHACIHVMRYLELHHNTRLFFDPTRPVVDEGNFDNGANWKDFYGDIEEAIPEDAPEPRGKSVVLRAMVDSDHAGDKETRRSRTGFVIFMNLALITWMSKKQATVESSVFGAEFVAMKHCVEELRALRYKVRMMGVPLEGATFVFGDNMSVITNTSKPVSTLKKKSNSICYHAVREAVAMGECVTGHIRTHFNYADLLTKALSGVIRRRLVHGLLYDIYDDHQKRVSWN